MKEEYPFQENWPIEGFALNDNTGQFVQIRIIQSEKRVGSAPLFPTLYRKNFS